MQNATTKYCPKCKADKPIDGFSRNRSTADGRPSRRLLAASRRPLALPVASPTLSQGEQRPMKRRSSCLNRARDCHLYGELVATVGTKGNAATSAGTDFHTLAEAHLTGQPWPDVENTEVIPEAQEWASWWDGLGLGAPTDVEVTLHFTAAAGDLLVDVPGHADAVWDDADNDTVIVVDWKRVQWSFGYPDIEDDLQLLAYGAGAMDKYGRSKAIIMRVHVPALEVHSHEMGIGDVDRLKDAVLALSADAEPSPSPDCDTCLARHACEAYQREAHYLVPMSTMEGPLDGPKANKLALAIPAARELLKRAEGALKAYVRDGGVVERDGKRWNVKPKFTDRIVDGDAAVDELETRIGEAADDYSKTAITKANLVKACKAHDIDVDLLLDALRDSGAVKTTEGEDWRWVKVKS